MSLFSATGLSISIFDPIIVVGTSYTPRGQLLDDSLADQLEGAALQFEILANGGWWSASLTLSLSAQQLEWWFENGLNKHIEIYNTSGAVVWAGFCNMITISMGTLSAQRGPLMDVANRVSVTYSPILDATTEPPIEGTETTTTIDDNAASQALYAIFEDIVSGGRLLDDGTTDDAILLRDTYLEEHKDAESGEDLTVPASAGTSCTLDFLGYVHRLQKQVYQDTTAATVQVSDKIESVLAADPNGLFSTDYSKIETNAVLTSGYDNDNRSAWDVLQELVSLGDAASNRYTIGIYEEQQMIYAAMPTSLEYQHKITENNQVVEYFETGHIVQPWDTLPARWVFLTDFLTGKDEPVALRDDPRSIFIESVAFSAPNIVAIKGTKVSQIPQMIARLAG